MASAPRLSGLRFNRGLEGLVPTGGGVWRGGFGQQASVGRRAAERLEPSGPGKENERKSRRASTLAEDHVPLQTRKGTRTSCETEDGTSLLSSHDTRNEFTAAYEGNPGAQGHLGQNRPPRATRVSQTSCKEQY
ncbi:hypothetical protein NN561_009372 [Cricetulus griseus]